MKNVLYIIFLLLTTESYIQPSQNDDDTDHRSLSRESKFDSSNGSLCTKKSCPTRKNRPSVITNANFEYAIQEWLRKKSIHNGIHKISLSQDLWLIISSLSKDEKNNIITTFQNSPIDLEELVKNCPSLQGIFDVCTKHAVVLKENSIDTVILKEQLLAIINETEQLLLKLCQEKQNDDEEGSFEDKEQLFKKILGKASDNSTEKYFLFSEQETNYLANSVSAVKTLTPAEFQEKLKNQKSSIENEVHLIANIPQVLEGKDKKTTFINSLNHLEQVINNNKEFLELQNNSLSFKQILRYCLSFQDKDLAPIAPANDHWQELINETENLVSTAESSNNYNEESFRKILLNYLNNITSFSENYYDFLNVALANEDIELFKAILSKTDIKKLPSFYEETLDGQKNLQIIETIAEDINSKNKSNSSIIFFADNILQKSIQHNNKQNIHCLLSIPDLKKAWLDKLTYFQRYAQEHRSNNIVAYIDENEDDLEELGDELLGRTYDCEDYEIYDGIGLGENASSPDSNNMAIQSIDSSNNDQGLKAAEFSGQGNNAVKATSGCCIIQ